MKGKFISEKFNLSNRAKLWELRTYHGYSNIEHHFCDPLGRITNITGEHADRLMLAGHNIYADIPWDSEDPNAPKV